MNITEIPLTTALGKTVLVGTSLLVVLLMLYWTVPRFLRFCRTACGYTKGRKLRVSQTGFGVLVYLLIFSVTFLIGTTGVAIARKQATRISEEGIWGDAVSCDRGIGVMAVSCSWPLTLWSGSPGIIRWHEIDRVECQLRVDGSVRELRIASGPKRVLITSLVVYDLAPTIEIIRNRAPDGKVQVCRLDIDN